ncbi:MAG: diguanylate cyclase [Gammaproteobacteria bacterium]|nr:diguanylate cyclase [Gammaproteobacteria bacterium]
MNVQLQEEISNRLRAESALRKANKTLQRLATLDGLTQIANRRSLDGYLKQEWHRLAREQAPLSCIMCDIDYFKNYNDAYGHQAGDDCLKLVAQTISQTVMRPADLAARYGGEEFAVILPGANAESAMLVARSIWQGVNRLGIPHARSLSEDRVTLSLGVASMIPKSDSSSEVLMVMADKALYTAKKQGRNQVVLNAMQAVPRRLPAKP